MTKEQYRELAEDMFENVLDQISEIHEDAEFFAVVQDGSKEGEAYEELAIRIPYFMFLLDIAKTSALLARD